MNCFIVWKILTVQIQDVAIFLGFNKNCIYGLTRKNRIEIGSLYSWPQESIFNYIAWIVFILIVNKYTIYEPSNLRLWSTCLCVNKSKIWHKYRISANIVNMSTMALLVPFVCLFAFRSIGFCLLKISAVQRFLKCVCVLYNSKEWFLCHIYYGCDIRCYEKCQKTKMFEALVGRVRKMMEEGVNEKYNICYICFALDITHHFWYFKNEKSSRKILGTVKMTEFNLPKPLKYEKYFLRPNACDSVLLWYRNEWKGKKILSQWNNASGTSESKGKK